MDKSILNKISLYYHTVRFLRWEQILYRIYYVIRRIWRKMVGFQYLLSKSSVSVAPLNLPILETSPQIFVPGTLQFTFLNKTHVFGKQIGWNIKDYGKLWQYNLHYFEYLLQTDIEPIQGQTVIEDFIRSLPKTPEALEPYPTALRLINWTQFLSKHNLDVPEINASLCAQAYILKDNLEYHILANHLLENGFGLLFAAYYCKDAQLYHVARKILLREIPEQILADGGHYERSPMYHQLILRRMLDTYALLKLNPPFESHDDLLKMVANTAPRMLRWMQEMAFPGETIARFHDSVDGIAPTAEKLLRYAQQLDLSPALGTVLGKPNGYWWYSNEVYKIIADVGAIGPDYQPGHAHCNALSFECYIGGRPAIVNTGISTYEKNARRQYERSTAAHNTVQIGNWEQSEVWGGFRVGRRAKLIVEQYQADRVKAAHTGCGRWRARHQRSIFCSEAYVQITDMIVGDLAPSAKAYFHCPPGLVLLQEGSGVSCDLFRLQFQGEAKITIEQYAYCQGFNQLMEANRIVVEFDNMLQATLYIK